MHVQHCTRYGDIAGPLGQICSCLLLLLVTAPLCSSLLLQPRACLPLAAIDCASMAPTHRLKSDLPNRRARVDFRSKVPRFMLHSASWLICSFAFASQLPSTLPLSQPACLPSAAAAFPATATSGPPPCQNFALCTNRCNRCKHSSAKSRSAIGRCLCRCRRNGQMQHRQLQHHPPSSPVLPASAAAAPAIRLKMHPGSRSVVVGTSRCVTAACCWCPYWCWVSVTSLGAVARR